MPNWLNSWRTRFACCARRFGAQNGAIDDEQPDRRMDGLPNVVVRDLDVMPGIQKIRAGTFGRGVWESDLFVDTLVVGLEPAAVSEAGLLVYPNPATDRVHISLNQEILDVGRLKLIDVSGRILQDLEVEPLGDPNWVVDLQGVASGIYLLVLEVPQGTFVGKIRKE